MEVSPTPSPGWPQTVFLLVSASQLAGITGLSHHGWLPLCLLFFKFSSGLLRFLSSQDIKINLENIFRQSVTNDKQKVLPLPISHTLLD
jgi:hypothetical protein